METDLQRIKMNDGTGRTAMEFLLTQREDWRPIETKAIFECLKRDWLLHLGNILAVSREISRKEWEERQSQTSLLKLPRKLTITYLKHIIKEWRTGC